MCKAKGARIIVYVLGDRMYSCLQLEKLCVNLSESQNLCPVAKQNSETNHRIFYIYIFNKYIQNTVQQNFIIRNKCVNQNLFLWSREFHNKKDK